MVNSVSASAETKQVEMSNIRREYQSLSTKAGFVIKTNFLIGIETY